MQGVFHTRKQTKRCAYWSNNNNLLGINDHVTADHTSTSLIAGTVVITGSVQNCYTKL